MTALTQARSASPGRSVLIAFLFFILVGGGASVAIRITYEEMAPFLGSRLSFWSGSVRILGDCSLQAVISLPKGRALWVRCCLGFSHRWVGFHTDRLGSCCYASQPLSDPDGDRAVTDRFSVFSARHRSDQRTRRARFASGRGGYCFHCWRRKLLGSVTAARCRHPPGGCFLAEGGVLIKKFPPNPPIMTNAISMTVGGLVLTVTSLVSGEPGPCRPS